MVRRLQVSPAEKGINAEVTRTSDLPRPHNAQELELLLPADLLADSWSVTAEEWGDPKLRRALKQLGVATKAAHVVIATGSAKGGPRAVLIYSVPEVATDRLEAGFASVLRIGGTKDTGVENVGGRLLHRSQGPDWVAAWWVEDGIVVSCSAPDDEQLRSSVSAFD
jgi:hypothetical protein